MLRLLALTVVCGLASPGFAAADTYSYYYESLEWLTDASDSIVEATLVPSPYTGNPADSKATVKTVHRVLKEAGKNTPAKGDEIPTHLARGDSHRVLLFTRPGEKPGERVVYCVYVTADNTPEGKKSDPFTRLPCQSSSRQRLTFNSPYCVAIDRTGKVLTDPKAVTELVEARIKLNPKRVSSAGRSIKCGPKVDDGDDHNLVIPDEPKPK